MRRVVILNNDTKMRTVSSQIKTITVRSSPKFQMRLADTEGEAKCTNIMIDSANCTSRFMYLKASDSFSFFHFKLCQLYITCVQGKNYE